MPIPAYRAKQSTDTAGTGTIVLNAAGTNARSFAAAYGASSRRVMYCISWATGFEIGYGDFDGGTPGSLTRETVLASSNAGALVTLPAGTKDVFAVFDPAAREVLSIAGTTTLGLADLGNAVVFTGASAATLNLPAVATVPAGAGWMVRNAGTAALTIDGSGAETINGAATLVLQAGQAGFIFDGGAAWECIIAGATPVGATLLAASSSAAAADILSAAPLDIASAATTNIGAATSTNVRITGTTTITSFGTAASGVTRQLRFAASLTLTHNATSLILPAGANIVTAAGDTATAISLGSGNWVVTAYQRANMAGMLDFVQRQTVSVAVGSVDFVLPAGFQAFEIAFDQVRLATDGASLWLRGSTDGGATFLAGTQYVWGATYNNNTSAAVGAAFNAQSRGVISGAADNAISDVTVDGRYRFTVGSATRRAIFMGQSSAFDDALSVAVSWNGTVWITGGASINAIRLLASSGNIASGTFTLTGIR